MSILSDRPGPKRNDPRRIAALKENARRQMEAELFEDCRTLKRQGAKRSDIMLCTREGRRAQAGVIVSETEDGSCWVLKLASGRLTEYLKSNCERLTSREAGKAIRQVRQQLKLEEPKPDTIFGDGDI